MTENNTTSQEKSPILPAPVKVSFFLGNQLIKFFGSIPFVLVILFLLTVAMAWATRIDALYGSQVGAWAFYRSAWFIGLLGLLCLGVLGAMLNSRRWTKRHVGFLSIHGGIIILFVGCLLSLLFGWEADLTIYEGCQRDSAVKRNNQVCLKVYNSDPSTEIETANRNFDAHKPVSASSGQLPYSWVKFPLYPGPMSWSEYNKLGFFPWQTVKPKSGKKYSGIINNLNVTFELLDFRKPFRETSTADTLALSVRPADKTESSATIDRLSGEWTEINLQAAKSINQGLIGRSRLTGGQQVSYRKLRSSDQLAAFIGCIPEKTVTEDLFVFYYKGKIYRFTVKDFLPNGKTVNDLRSLESNQLPTQNLGGDIKISLINLESAMGAAVFEISLKNPDGSFESVNSITLLNLLSEFNRVDPRLGIYGEYYRPEQKIADETPADSTASMRNKLIGPRYEIAASTDGQLYFRQCINGTVKTGELSLTRPTIAFQGTDFAAAIIPLQDMPGVRLTPIALEEQQPSESDPAAALVRITTPDSVVERWITLGVNNPLNPPDCYRKNDYITLECKDSAGKAKWLVVSIPREKVELNFQILLERFNRRLDPGTSMPSHYSSDITVVDNSIVSNKTAAKFEHVRVQLNQPVNFVNPKNGQSYRIYQSSFSGPIDTSSPIYRWVVGNQIQPTDASAPLYSSTFTVNYDPGRGMLYLGCLLICFGIGFHYYLRGAKPMKNPMKLPDEKPKNANVSVLSSVVLIISMMLCLSAFADSKTDCVDLSLESLPVLESGRVQPLNTVAINAVKSICGSSTPTLSLDGAAISGELNTHSAGQITRLFAQSSSRSFTALELFYRWQIEPEVWEHIPFIECSNPDLRRLLGVNLLDSRGQALKYVSPVQIVRSSALPDYRYNFVQQQQQEQRAGITHQSTKLEKSVLKLLDAFEKYRAITFYPQAAENPRDACAELVSRILQTQMTLLPSEIQSECAKNNDSKISTLPQKISQYGQSFQNIFISYSQSQEYKQTDRSLDSIVNQINLYDDAIDIYIQFVQNRIKYNKDKSKQLIYTDSLRALESIEKDLILLRFRLYDEGGLPGVVPSLNPMAVDLWRNPDDHTAVWLSIPTLLYGDTVVLAGFPQDKIAQFRLLYSQAAESILNDDYPAAIKAQQKLTENIKSLAAFADSKRLTLLPENRLDKQVLSASAYPVSKKACQLIQWELFYYQLKPFQWALIFSAMATILFVIGSIIPNWGERKIRIVLQWGAGALMLAGVGFIGYGLLLRGYIMSRSPVANMFETIMFVAFMTGLLGLFLPLFPPGTSVIGKAWQQTAFTTGSRKPIYWIVQIIRWIIAAVLFYALVFVSYGAGQGYSAVSLTPRLAMGASIPGLSDVLVWLASILLLIIVIFWIPRVVCTVLYLCTDYIFKDKMKSDSSEMESRSFTQFDTLIAQACGAGLMCLLTGAAINAPMFNDDLKNLMPILRDNFWLAIHVISIVGGYGTAMLAWILGNAALTAFAVGQYRLQKSADNPDKITPPEITRTLSSLMYSCIKATIWLLAIGIILGGLWADVSWGRFWSWDRKEVWALISMVVYLIFVHALHWGWFKNNRELTMTLASVSGALAILMAWYGVNYLLGSTMHGYASGSGGLAPAIAFVGANIAFVALAMVRYVSEMRRLNSNQQQ